MPDEQERHQREAHAHLRAAADSLSKAADHCGQLGAAEFGTLASIMCTNLATMALNIQSRLWRANDTPTKRKRS